MGNRSWVMGFIGGEINTITNYLLPITYYQLPITHYLLPITHYPLPASLDLTSNLSYLLVYLPTLSIVENQQILLNFYRT
jgi:hypothetical protein